MGDWTKRGTTGHYHCTSSGQMGGGHPDEAGRKISRPTPAGRTGIERAKRRRRPLWVTGHLLIFQPFMATSSHPIAPFHHFWTLRTHFRGLFLQIHHRLKDTTKTNLADYWIEFFGHHSNLWTKVRVLMCSWSLGLSIDMWFVNFGRRLVSFHF